MKVRVTLMTENNKHINEDISDEEIQKNSRRYLEYIYKDAK